METIIKELYDKGFESSTKAHKLVEGAYYMQYEYSDFEMLEFTAYEKDAPIGKILVIDELSLTNYYTNEIYIKIDYDLVFKSVDEFLQLLKLLGYKI